MNEVYQWRHVGPKSNLSRMRRKTMGKQIQCGCDMVDG